MESQKVPYGQCVGVSGRVMPHTYKDGKNHYPNSHGLCPKCLAMTLRQIDARRYRTDKAMLTGAARVIMSP